MSMITCACGCKTAAEEHKILECCICKKPFKYNCIDITITEARTIKNKKGLSWSCRNCAVLGNDINELKAAILDLKSEIQSRNTDIIDDSIFEELLREIQDRNERKQNIIMYNHPETGAGTLTERKAQDEIAVKSILGTLPVQVNVNHIEVYRLGRFDGNSNRIRPLRVKFSNVKDVHTIIKHAKHIRNSSQFNNISISLDRTVRQVNYYKKLKAEMSDRIANGEGSLAIKYKRGIPSIQSLN